MKIILHGYLKDLYPHDIVLDASTVAEAINGMCKMTKAFNPKLGEKRHTFQVVGFNSEESLFAPTDKEELHLVPMLFGGKSKGGFIQIAIGVALIIASFYFPPAGLLGAEILTGSLAFSLGASLVLGGLLAILSPAPNIDLAPIAQDPEASKFLGAPKNTVKIGTRIPLIYGEHMAFGHYLSFNIDAKSVAL